MSKYSLAAKSLGTLSTTALLTIGSSLSSHAMCDDPPKVPSDGPIHISGQELDTELQLFSQSLTQSSGVGSLSNKIYDDSQIDNIAKDFIANLRDSQTNIDVEIKALITENLWDLYD